MTAAMSSKLYTTVLRQCIRQSRPSCPRPRIARQYDLRTFGTSRTLNVVKPFLLADIGEGITECQIIQWFVQPGARVEQFDKICEVQSDKASVEITSRFDGIIKKLHYEKDDVARVGKPLLDIDIQSDISAEDEAVIAPPQELGRTGSQEATQDSNAPKGAANPNSGAPVSGNGKSMGEEEVHGTGKAATLATPAVRRITKELGIAIADVTGSGRDGRVLKEDVQKFASGQLGHRGDTSAQGPRTQKYKGDDRTVQLTATQSAMYKTMTRSLSIPHFLYTDMVDFTDLSKLRRRLNHRNADDPVSKDGSGKVNRISALAFIIKAISLAFQEYPQLNAHLDASNDKPAFTVKGAHHIGIAVDSPSGLIVPVIKNAQSHSISSLAAEITRLSSLAREGRLTSQDLQGATFTVSNVGSIGGTVVAPVIVPPQVAIVGIGKARIVPGFGDDGTVVKKEECVFSWSADHRVLDGATVARAAETVRIYLENVEDMLVGMT